MPRMSTVTKSLRKNWLKVVLLALALGCIHYAGLFDHLFELNYEEFRWPLEVDIKRQVERLKANLPPDILPLRKTHFDWVLKNESRCAAEGLFLVFLVKSALPNRIARDAIRETWGQDRNISCKKCPGEKVLQLRRYFLLGASDSTEKMASIEEEQLVHGDILQQSFIDFYYNNTYKTLMGLKFAARFCPSAKFFLFVDDDYHVGVANLLKLLLGVQNNASDLYLGYRFFTHVMRHHWSRYRLSLSEFPYITFPPYITAGAYVMSAKSVEDFHLAAQFVRPFRFDDVFMGIIAKKLGVRPRHNDKFLFWEQNYNPANFKDVIAAHGFKDVALMRKAAKFSESLLEEL